MNEDNNPNKLINEKSPYLRQHAYNTVEWYPWCEEAFDKAGSENKPVFLSIGYSTCHWCHVMEKESFVDPDIASMMNEAFINIKVDREERPDIDSVYMTVCQLMTGSGGWPLTVLLTPDKKPFFAGTYFPKESKYGRIGMKELIPKIMDVWNNKMEDILASSREITRRLNVDFYGESMAEFDSSLSDKTYDELRSAFDKSRGGFGSAPKFPAPHKLLFLLRYWKRTGKQESLVMVEKTLKEMRFGGMYDHIGYGFHRYSTDEKWLVPHFEKMLYDQAVLALAYTETYLATGNDFYKRTAEEILEYISKDMTSAEGGFFSAEDADSEGEEGKFYIWDKTEIEKIAGISDNFVKYLNITQKGNFADPHTTAAKLKNIPHLTGSLENFAKENGLDTEEFRLEFENSRKAVYLEREKRKRPLRDDKILTDWNGLMISAFALAGRSFGNIHYINAAKSAADFILSKLGKESGELLHRYHSGESAIAGMLDDYAFLTWGLLDLYEASFEIKYLQKAIRITDYMIKNFFDKESGGFFLSSVTGEQLITKTKELYDGAIPSGNSVALMNLVRLSKITADNNYKEFIDKSINTFSAQIEISPSSFSYFMSAAEFLFSGSKEIVIVADKEDSEPLQEMIKTVNMIYLPFKVILLKTPENSKFMDETAEYTKSMEIPEKVVQVYVCRNYACELPVNNVFDLLNLLN